MPFNQGHALIIGVGTHRRHPEIDMPIMAADAAAVADVLCDPRTCGYLPERVQCLQEYAATRAGILTALKTLAERVADDDTVFLFYCGHGAIGNDGNYYLVSHDARLQDGRVELGTGVSEAELLYILREIPARRMLMIFNSPSPDAGPSLDAGQKGLAVGNLCEDTAFALLGTGQGRIVITACREAQVSHVGSGRQTIFTQALLEGLNGKGVRNNNGFIGAFNLYEHIYESVTEAARARADAVQEPELTVRNQASPFAVALYRGASTLREFACDESLPMEAAVRLVSPEKCIRRFEQRVGRSSISTGSGAIAIGADKLEIGKGGISVGSDVSGSTNINSGQTIYGDYVMGDKALGEKIGRQINISDASVAKGQKSAGDLSGCEHYASEAPSSQSAESSREMVLLASLLQDYFSLAELRDISYQLDMNWEVISTDSKSQTARALVAWLAHRGQLSRLKVLIRVARPQLRSQLG